MLCLSLSKNVYLLPTLIKEFMSAQKSYIAFKNYAFKLSHRDLVPENIIMHRNRPYLIDCGACVLTHPDYDLSYLAVRPLSKKLYTGLAKDSHYTANEFLKSYIKIQLADAHLVERVNYQLARRTHYVYV